jgi:tRNA G26 N,N-dimethylase Trm1
MAIKATVDFAIDCKGELTGNQYTGSFVAKTKLSMKESLKQDEIYRSILGANSQDAADSSKKVAAAISYLMTHLVTSPEFWKAQNLGMDCEDMNLLAEINNVCQSKIEAEYKKLAEEAKASEELLKAIPTV